MALRLLYGRALLRCCGGAVVAPAVICTAVGALLVLSVVVLLVVTGCGGSGLAAGAVRLLYGRAVAGWCQAWGGCGVASCCGALSGLLSGLLVLPYGFPLAVVRIVGRSAVVWLLAVLAAVVLVLSVCVSLAWLLLAVVRCRWVLCFGVAVMVGGWCFGAAAFRGWFCRACVVFWVLLSWLCLVCGCRLVDVSARKGKQKRKQS